MFGFPEFSAPRMSHRKTYVVCPRRCQPNGGLIEIDNTIGPHPTDAQRRNTIAIFDRWLEDRELKHVRYTENILLNEGVFRKTVLVPGVCWNDVEDDASPEFPFSVYGEQWSFYAVDFKTDVYASVAEFLHVPYFLFPDNGGMHLPEGLWLRYHGCSLYALSSMLSTGYPVASDVAVKGAEQAEGRGVYTSRLWYKAVQYATPHLLEGAGCLLRAVVLLAVPGSAGSGGVALWTKASKQFWAEGAPGDWTKRPKWLLVPPEQADDVAASSSGPAVPHPDLQKRILPGNVSRKPGTGEIPWTNTDGVCEDQSSVAHVVGFFLSACSATEMRRARCNSRSQSGFLGWDHRLEPPFARPPKIAGASQSASSEV